MKIYNLTSEQKIRLLAELDGFNDFIFSNEHDRFMVRIKGETDWIIGKKYLTSYDAIIPLLQKLPHETRCNFDHLMVVMFGSGYDLCSYQPHHICDAVLVAMEKAEL